jgi:predicted Zn-dependent protease
MKLLAIFAAVVIAGAPAFAQSKPRKVKSKAEATAVNAVIQAQDPDSRIKAADELLAKFADTEYKPEILYMEAESYLTKNDIDKAVFYAEQALDADPKAFQADVLLAKAYAGMTHVNDLDKAEKLAKIQKYGQEGLDNVAGAAKPNAQLADAEWDATKKDLQGQCYYALAVAAIYGNKMDEANAHLQKVADLDTDITDLIRGARAMIDAKQYAAAIPWLDKVAADPKASAQVKQIANSDKARASAMVKK